MKRFLLTTALAVTLAIPVSAEYHHFPDNSTPPEYQDWEHMISYRLIDREKKTVSFSSINPDRNNPACMHGDVTVPSTVNCTFTLWDVEGTPEITDNFTVVQIDDDTFSYLDVTSVTIPATIEAIGPCSFRGVNTLTSLIFEESDKPLELYRGFNEWDESPITNLTINRSIVTKEWELNGWMKDEGKNYLPVSNENVTVTIGPKVKALGAELFKNVPNVVRTNLSNWQTWVEDVELGDIYSNPYRESKSELYVGGLRFTTVEIPEGTESITDYKFAGLNFEGELTLPSSLKRIGDWAFYNNKDLYYITFPEGLESIGAHAFDGCETLRFDALPANLKEIGDYAFTGCDLITSITLPEGIETLGEGAFCRMDGLQKAVLFSGLTELPARLFQECASLTNVYLPKQLISIGDRAFAYCPKLEDVTLPQTLEKIGMAAFCMSINEQNGIIFDYYYEDALDADPSHLYLPLHDNNLTSIQLPASLREIGGFAFAGSYLVTLEMNEGLESVGPYAFYKTPYLRDLKLPATLKNIGTGAFGIDELYYGDIFLTDVTIPASVTEIGKYAFINRSIGQFNMEGSATSLPESSCGHPSILNVGGSVKNIDPIAFEVTGINNIQGLRLIRMQSATPPSVSAAFNIAETDYDKILLIVPNGSKATYQRNPRWEKFTTVEESESDIMVHVTGESPISEEIRIQSGLMPSRVAKMKVTGTLSETDFRLIRENMQSLYSLDLSAISNTEIPNEGLKGMTLLTDIQLPAGTTRIGERAFEGNTLMDTPALPESVTEIAGSAFYDCTRLSITKLPDALKKLYGGYNFSNCKSLRTLTAGENLITIQGENEMEAMGTAYMFGGCSLLEFADFSKTKIKEIPNEAFSDCTNLQEIALPATLEAIGYQSFANTSLKSIALPEAMTGIGDEAFAATDLRTVNIPGKVTEIRSSTFKDCPRLVSVSFPTSLTQIGTTVFENSLKLAAISCAAIDAPEAESGAFTGIRSAKCSLTVPSQSFRSYLNAPQWGMFSELFNRIEVEVPDDADVSNVPEEEYQEIAEEERLAEEVEAPAEDENEDENPASVRRRLRLAARASHADGTGYAQLFNGATLSTSSDGKGTRIFVNMKHGATLKSVLYNGVDMTDKMEGNSLLLPAGSNGTLKIVSNNDGDGIEDVESASPADALCEVYDLQGRHAFSGKRNEVENVLSSGIYIVKTNGKTEKIVIR